MLVQVRRDAGAGARSLVHAEVEALRLADRPEGAHRRLRQPGHLVGLRLVEIGVVGDMAVRADHQVARCVRIEVEDGVRGLASMHHQHYLTKPVSSDDLLHAIERALAHHEAARGLKNKLDVVRAHISKLTPREREVFELVVRGKTNKQVANTLGATERTIKAHRQRVMEKMQVQSLAELVSLAERVGFRRYVGQRTISLDDLSTALRVPIVR